MLASLQRTQQGAQMRKGTRYMRTALGCCAALGAALSLVLLLQVTMTVGTLASQTKGEIDAPDLPPLGSAEPMDPCIELTEATLVGPPTGTVGIGHIFTVAVGPAEANLPVTYSWSTAQETLTPRLRERLTDTAEFTWNMTGSQRVTVTAVNPCLVTVSDSYTITIETQSWYVYLPLALRSYVSDPYEPNDTQEQAFGPLASGSPYIGYFPDPTDQDDWYYIDIVTLQPIGIHLTVPAQLDLDLWLYRSQSAVRGSAEVGKGIDEALEFTPGSTGTYYILVHRADEDTDRTAAYTLVATYDLP
jgi:hypothetical protein